MSRHKKFLARCIPLLLVLFSLSFQAQANVLGNMQTFAPNPDSLIFQNIHSSQTLEKNYFNIGFFAAYVRNELSTYDDLTTPSFVNYKDKAFTFDLIFAWGVTQYLELTYSMPGYFSQEPDSGQSQNNFISEGINGHRIGAKYNISQDRKGGFAVAGSADLTLAVDNPYIGNSPAPIWNFEFIYDQRDQNTGYGINVGYRKRTVGDPVTDAYFLPVGDQLIASAGYVWGLAGRWRFHAEIFGSYGLEKNGHPDQKYINSLEGLVGGKYRFAKNWWAHFGGTMELQPEGLAPEYRLYAGLNHFFGWVSKSGPQSTNMVVQPYELNLVQQESHKITVSGGTGPFTYSLSEELGSFDSTTMEYTAFDKIGDDELTVTDSTGATASIPIHIREKATVAALSMTPASAEIYAGGVVPFQVSGGQGPYTTSLSPASFGTISGKTFKYRAPMKPGEVRVTVRDQRGETVTSIVTVKTVPKPAKAITLANLNFVFDTNQLTKNSQKELDKNLGNMSQVKIKKIIVIGHTDDKGSEEYNQDLSQSRAEAVAAVIRQKFNLSKDQVEALGYGESQPIATNKTDKGRHINRRCELKLYYHQ
jgi:outer membrane protein OmpA-like peptidoglycan-associated protein